MHIIYFKINMNREENKKKYILETFNKMYFYNQTNSLGEVAQTPHTQKYEWISLTFILKPFSLNRQLTSFFNVCSSLNYSLSLNMYINITRRFTA